MSLACTIRSLALFAAASFITAAASGSGEKVIANRNAKKSAPKTPLAVYQKQVTDAIGSRWYAYTQNQSDLIAIGSLRMTFRILANGRVTGLKVLSNTSNEAFANVCRRAVLESKIPPIPDVVRRELGHDFLDWEEVNFTLYPD